MWGSSERKIQLNSPLSPYVYNYRDCAKYEFTKSMQSGVMKWESLGLTEGDIEELGKAFIDFRPFMKLVTTHSLVLLDETRSAVLLTDGSQPTHAALRRSQCRRSRLSPESTDSTGVSGSGISLAATLITRWWASLRAES